jgi:Peptidase family C25/Propeptide_C25/Fibronectin type III domain
MNARALRALATGGLLLGLAAPGLGSGSGATAVPLSLTVSEPHFVQTGGGLVPRLDGFGITTRPGEPALPVKILLVAIPAGATPTLRLIGSTTRALGRVDVAPVPGVHDVAANGSERVRAEESAGFRQPGNDTWQEFRRDAEIYGHDRSFPEEPLRLGDTGALRDQSYVEVVWTPIAWNPVTGIATIVTHLDAEVVFSPPSGTGTPFRPDPQFEKDYKASLLNYEQGKIFRAFGAGRGANRGGGAAAALTESLTTSPIASGTSRYKLQVTQEGVCHLDATWMTAHAPDLAAVDPRTLAVEVDGAEIPILIRDAAGNSGEADGVFDSGDALEFYGRPKTEPPTVPNLDFGASVPGVYEANDFTDTQVYWLSASGAPGSHLRIPARSGAPTSGYATAVDFGETVVWEQNNIFIPLGAVDPYFSLPSLLAGSAQDHRDVSVALPGLASSSASASVVLRLRGGTDTPEDPDHKTHAWVNGDTADFADFTWGGETIREQQFSVPQSVLTNPATVHLQAPGLAGVIVDQQYLDTISVSYRRQFVASSDFLRFSVPNQDTRFTVTGLGSTPPAIWEVGRALAGNGETDVVRITDATPAGAPTPTWTFEMAQDLTPGAPPTRTFAVAGPAALRVPDAVTAAAAPSLRVPGQSADYIVIGSTETLDASPGGSLDLLLGHRLAAQGLTSRVVFINQVYDEFSGGRRDANAIRSFLAYAYANWRGPAGTDPPPSYVLLVGDATPDYKDNLNRGDWIDQVPTPVMFQVNSIIGYYSSDNWLASVSGADQIPDLHLGRISTRTAAESAQVFDKIRWFETGAPAGVWKGRALLTAGDEKGAGEAAAFQAIDDDIRNSYFTTAPYSSPAPPLYFQQPPWSATDAAGFNAAMTTELMNGVGVFTYVGHGNFDNWGLETVFTAANAAALSNGLKLPFMFNVNCLSGGFHYLVGTGSIAEDIVNNPNGGAIAAFAPSGLSSTMVGSVAADSLFLPLFGPERQTTLGPATLPVRVALLGHGLQVDMQAYTFLGDPASQIATPAPPPPGALAAVGGNGQVTLTWTPPAVAPAAIRIHRALAPSLSYQVITCTPAGPNSCTDTSVVNATRYYYFATSADGDGFEGARSNPNDDCDAGPGCVTARPFNPNPPGAPTGLFVRDQGSGGRLSVSWSSNPETDIKTYTVRWGTAPGVYTTTQTVSPPATQTSLIGLQNGTLYYVTVTATNTSGLVSSPAPEQSAVPSLIQGIAPPRAISDLRLARSGADLILTWSRPLVDIYGRATTVVGYRVYYGTTPGFSITGATPIATIGSGATTTWTHVGGISLPANGYYLVTAGDASGLWSGAGRDLPNGIGDLDVTSPSASTVHLAWLPVTTDVQGLATLVGYYQIHITSTPVSRANLGPSTLFMDHVTQTAIDLPLPTSPRFISVLVVDDRGNVSPF